MTRQAWTITSPLESPRFAWLDTLADPLQQGLHKVFRANTAGRWTKNVLNGVPWRHRVHPALIVAPIGAFTTAVVLDALDARASRKGDLGYRKSADASIAFGLMSAIPTAAAGMADWVDTYDHHRRVGMAHALLNTVALGLYGISLAARLSGNRKTAWALSGAGYGLNLGGAALGGELVYNLGINVSHNIFPKPPTDYSDVLSSADLPEGQPVVRDVGRVPVMLYRHEGQVYAVEGWCTHVGGPLNEGEFRGDEVVCPWHGSRFCLADGRPLDGPASAPLHTFEVREEGGRISVRPSYEGQGWPPAPEPPAEAPAMPTT